MNASAPVAMYAPPPPPVYQMAKNDATQWKTGGLITEEEALRALREHAKKLCCWGEGPIDKMKIKICQPSTAYKVVIHKIPYRRPILTFDFKLNNR